MAYVDNVPHAGSAEVLYTGMYDEPAGTVARTIPRAQVANLTQAPTSTIPVARILPLAAGTVLNNISVMVSQATGETGGTHGWLAVTDINANVLAVTADQTGATYFAAGTFVKTPFTLPTIIQFTGSYYCVVSVTAGTQMPNFGGAPGAGANATLSGVAPIFMGTFGAQSTPPAIGSNLGTLTATGSNANIAFWIS